MWIWTREIQIWSVHRTRNQHKMWCLRQNKQKNIEYTVNLLSCTVISIHKIYLIVLKTAFAAPPGAAGGCRKRTGCMYKVYRVSQEAEMRCERGKWTTGEACSFCHNTSSSHSDWSSLTVLWHAAESLENLLNVSKRGDPRMFFHHSPIIWLLSFPNESHKWDAGKGVVP